MSASRQVSCHGADAMRAAVAVPRLRRDVAADPIVMLGCLRVLLVGPLPPPAGGMANQTQQLAELLRREWARVDVVAVNAPYRPAWAGRIKGVRAGFRLVPYLWSLWRACGRADLVHVMANSGWSWHLFAAPAVWIAWLRRTPVVVNYRGGAAGDFLRQAAPWVRSTMRRAGALVLPSDFLLEVFARYGMQGRIVSNVVDIDRFYPISLRPERGAAPHLVVARNLEAIYGNDVALHAFALLLEEYPAARLTLAGSGPETAALHELARSLGVAERVRFPGRLDRDQMAALYRDADLMINASRVDNTPNAILEALASGVPVVSTDVGGISYLVHHLDTAMLVQPDEPAAMAAAIKAVLTNQDLRNRLVSNGLTQVSRYRWQSVRSELAAVYQAALQAAGRQLG